MAATQSQPHLATASLVRVALPVPHERAYDYVKPEGMRLHVGDVVQVPFGVRKIWGVVIELDPQKDLPPADKLKPIAQVSPYGLGEKTLKFLQWVAAYTVSPLGMVLKLSIPVAEALDRREALKEFGPIEAVEFPYTEEQVRAIDVLEQQVKKQKGVTLLDGVTGSGKTEVYFAAVSHVCEVGSQALILLPEIALTPQMTQRFATHFGVEPTLWHSGLTPAQRRKNWQAIVRGEARVIIGARSALFLPYANLGLIVVDEEHEGSYKQEDVILYQGRDMAVVRGHLEGVHVILASATPSLETWVNARQGKYVAVHLASRPGAAVMPKVEIIDRRGRDPKGSQWMSGALIEAINQTVAEGEQTLLFLNRRGYAPLTLCRACGERLMCPNCAAWLVDHRHYSKLICHYCGHHMRPSPTCRKCGAEDAMTPCGPGVERLAEDVAKTLPHLRTLIVSSDIVNTPKKLREAMEAIAGHAVDLVIGTQLMAKGHHFPNLTLVGVIDADLGLHGGDPRASERTFQLLHQVAGRAGRAEREGRVLLQTYYPDHPVMQALISSDREAFYEAEQVSRQGAQLPPFGRLAALIVEGRDGAKVEEVARRCAHVLAREKNIQILGPAPAPLQRLRKNIRWRLLLSSGLETRLQPALRCVKASVEVPSGIKLILDVDPYGFL